jgi:hypothetical protein
MSKFKKMARGSKVWQRSLERSRQLILAGLSETDDGGRGGRRPQSVLERRCASLERPSSVSLALA